MTLAASDALLSAWLVLPLAGVTMVVIAAHVIAMQHAMVPPKRRRIRTVAGLLMMVVTALLAYALCIDPFSRHPATHPGEARTSLLLWMAIVGLVGVIVVLAALDALHTLSLGLLARRKIRDAMIEKLAAQTVERAKGGAGAGGGAANGSAQQGEHRRG